MIIGGSPSRLLMYLCILLFFRYGSKPEDVFQKHVKDLMQFAEKNIPADQHNETPLFILATAGKYLNENPISWGFLIDIQYVPQWTRKFEKVQTKKLKILVQYIYLVGKLHSTKQFSAVVNWRMFWS